MNCHGGHKAAVVQRGEALPLRLMLYLKVVQAHKQDAQNVLVHRCIHTLRKQPCHVRNL